MNESIDFKRVFLETLFLRLQSQLQALKRKLFFRIKNRLEILNLHTFTFIFH